MKANLEPLLHLPGRFLNAKRVRLPAFDHPYHFHPEIEIMFISRSSGTRVIGDHIGSFVPGELYLLGSNLPHAFRNAVPPSHGAEAEVLHFPHHQPPFESDVMPELQELDSLLERSKGGLVFDAEVSRRGGQLLQRIRTTTGVGRFAAFFELAATLLDAPKPEGLVTNPDLPPPCQTGASRRIHRVCNTILEEFKGDICHAEMARRANMAPAAFSRMFRRTTRKTFTQFLTEVRLGHACRLLLQSDTLIADAAFESGFKNLAHFNRCFRKHHGCSPREYRSTLIG